MDKESFLNKYRISNEDFSKTKLEWSNLMEIFEDYSKYKVDLEEPAIYLFNTLMKSPNVHSVRYRIKDSEHLIEKIIRKKIENKDSDINISNYKEVVTDLIGLRALHLFKDDWLKIHEFISEKWNRKQIPIAYYRDGDTQDLIKVFEENGCEAKVHKYGYRSVHYIIETQPAKVKFYAEIQVRTIFEEAWSEIDHTIRYPYDIDNVLFFQFLLILNRLAGSADEMGSYIKFLKSQLVQREIEFQTQINEKSKVIKSLEAKVAKLNIKDLELRGLRSEIEKLKTPKLKTNTIYGSSILPSLGSIYSSQKNLLSAIDNLSKINETLTSFPNLGAITGYPKDLNILQSKIPKSVIKIQKSILDDDLNKQAE